MKNFYLLILFLTLTSISAQLNPIDLYDLIEDNNYSQKDILKIKSKFSYLGINNSLQSRSAIKARLDSSSLEFYSEVDNNYVPFSNRKYFYDTNQNASSYKRYSYNSTLGALWNSGRGDYSYDKKDKLIGITTFSIGRTTGIETPSIKYDYLYNNLGQCESESTQFYDNVNSEYYKFDKTEYFYNTKGFLDYSLIYDYNIDSARYELSSRFTNGYDNFNNNTYQFREDWDESTKSYIPDWKSKRNYNNKNKLILDQDSIWKDNSWYPYQEYYYKYNSSDKLITISYSSYDSASGIFIDTTREELSLDLAYQLNDIIIPDAFNIPLANSIWEVKLDKYESFDYNGGDWIESSRSSYFYELVNVSGLNKIESTNNIIYPNPTTGVVFVNTDLLKISKSVTVTDINGKQVKSLLIDFNTGINFSSLENGIYNLQLHLKDGNVIRNKVIKI